MGIFETFSKRMRKRELAGQPDVYQYDDLPDAFRRQVIHIWVSALGPFRSPGPFEEKPVPNIWWQQMHDILTRELGVFSLANERHDPFRQCQEFLLNTETLYALDLIELTFRWIDRVARKADREEREAAGIRQSADDAMAELNHRFREHSIGYQLEAGQLIRVDSQFVHAEVVKPAIALLRNARFPGPLDEFMRAHEHYRKEQYKEAISESLKAFESTMKAICHDRTWSHAPNATASKLIETIFANGLIPAELTSHFTSLQSMLQNGLPTVRNRNAGHGQGVTPVVVPDYLAAYAIHLAGANILLLLNAHTANP